MSDLENTKREWVKDLLREGTVDLSFIKKDGSVREMKATLKSDLIPDFKEQVEEQQELPGRKKPIDSLAVYDVEAGGWRSFRWDSLLTVSFQGYNNAAV